jgi:hypothetical protein
VGFSFPEFLEKFGKTEVFIVMDIQKIRDILYPKWDREGVNVNDLTYFSKSSQHDKFELVDRVMFDYVFNRSGQNAFQLDREYNIKGDTKFLNMDNELLDFEYDIYFVPTSIETQYDSMGTFGVEILGYVNPKKSKITNDGKVRNYDKYYHWLFSHRGGQSVADTFEFTIMYTMIQQYFNELFEENDIDIEIDNVYFPMKEKEDMNEDVLSEIKDIQRKMGLL